MNATGQNIVTPEICLSTCVENILSEMEVRANDKSIAVDEALKLTSEDLVTVEEFLSKLEYTEEYLKVLEAVLIKKFRQHHYILKKPEQHLVYHDQPDL